MKPWMLWVTGIAVIVGCILGFLYMRASRPPEPSQDEDGKPGVAARFKNATLVGRSGGKKIWIFEARTIEVGKDNRLATFSGITDAILLREGKRVALLSAKKAVCNHQTLNIVIPGSAELKLLDGPTLKVRNVYWNAEESRLLCSGGVDAILGGSTLHGERMIADLEKRELSIRKVRGRIRIEPETAGGLAPAPDRRASRPIM